MSSTTTHLGLLGGFHLNVARTLVPLPMNAQRLLAFLALQDHSVLRSFIAGSLWEDAGQHRAEGSLRSTLWRLPRPKRDLITLTNEQLELSPNVQVDIREGEALAHRILDTSQGLDDVTEVNEEILSADVLPDWTEDWVLLKRESYHQLRLRALEQLCRRLSKAGRSGQAVQAGLAAVSAEPLRESARRVLIEAHIAESNVAAASREFADFRELLQDELGVDPSDELRALVEQAT